MDNQISQRIQALQPSATLAMSQQSAELKAHGIDVINMSVGEPDFFTPDHIKQAAKRAIDGNFTFYSPATGYLSLRQAICDKLQRENGLEFTPSQIVVGNGAKHEIANVMLSVVNPGDEVLVPTPAWVTYVQLVALAGGRSVTLPTTAATRFKITPEQLEAALTPNTRMLILCSPSNPTGSVYSHEELQALAQVLAKWPRVVVVSDEIYEHITYVGHTASIAACPEMKDRVAVINGVSKAYAMTGWRIGYVAAPEWLAKAVAKLQGHYTSGSSSIAQKAAEAALTGPQDCVERMRTAFERRRNLIVSLLRGIHGIELAEPDGAFYVFPNMEHFLGKHTADGTLISDTSQLALYLLHEAHVATVSGEAFSAPGFLRLSYATSDENIVAASSRLAAALQKLV